MNENIDRVHSSGVGGRGAEKGGGRVFRLGTAVGGVACWLDFFRSGRTAHWNLPAWRRWPPLPVPRRKLTSAQPPRASDWRQKKKCGAAVVHCHRLAVFGRLPMDEIPLRMAAARWRWSDGSIPFELNEKFLTSRHTMKRVTKWTGGVQDGVNYFIHSTKRISSKFSGRR